MAQTKEQRSEYNKRYYAKNAEKMRERARIYAAINPDKVKQRNRDFYQNNRDSEIARSKDWAQKNPEKKSKYNKEYSVKNRKRLNAKEREYRKMRRATSPLFRISIQARVSARRIVKMGAASPGRSGAALGCDYDKARRHIESQFKPGMTWGNYGRNGWHIDHVRPLCSVDVSDPSDVLSALHYTNLQPMWAIDNLRKGGRHN